MIRGRSGWNGPGGWTLNFRTVRKVGVLDGSQQRLDVGDAVGLHARPDLIEHLGLDQIRPERRHDVLHHLVGMREFVIGPHDQRHIDGIVRKVGVIWCSDVIVFEGYDV